MRGRLSDNADDYVMVNDINLGHSVPQELLDGLLASFAAEYVHSQRDAVGDFLEGADLSPLGTHGEYIVERYLERRVRAARRASPWHPPSDCRRVLQEHYDVYLLPGIARTDLTRSERGYVA